MFIFIKWNNFLIGNDKKRNGIISFLSEWYTYLNPQIIPLMSTYCWYISNTASIFTQMVKIIRITSEHWTYDGHIFRLRVARPCFDCQQVRNISPRHHRQTGSGTHPASYPMGTWVSFLRVKRPERQGGHSLLFSTKVKNAWSFFNTPS